MLAVGSAAATITAGCGMLLVLVSRLRLIRVIMLGRFCLSRKLVIRMGTVMIVAWSMHYRKKVSGSYSTVRTKNRPMSIGLLVGPVGAGLAITVGVH